MEDILSINKSRVENRVSDMISIIKQYFELEEYPVKDELNNFTLNGSTFKVLHYAIKELGNLFIMQSTNNPDWMMDTVIINPYFKEVPLFCSDYLYMGEKRKALIEIYDLVDEEYMTDTYRQHVNKLNKNAEKYDHIENLPINHCWYEYLRPVYVAKSPKPSEDAEMYDLFVQCLNDFLSMAKSYPLIETQEEYNKKWIQNKKYADDLIKEGGEATNLFVEVLGKEFTIEFFEVLFFGPELYKDKFGK